MELASNGTGAAEEMEAAGKILEVEAEFVMPYAACGNPGWRAERMANKCGGDGDARRRRQMRGVIKPGRVRDAMPSRISCRTRRERMRADGQMAWIAAAGDGRANAGDIADKCGLYSGNKHVRPGVARRCKRRYAAARRWQILVMYARRNLCDRTQLVGISDNRELRGADAAAARGRAAAVTSSVLRGVARGARRRAANRCCPAEQPDCPSRKAGSGVATM